MSLGVGVIGCGAIGSVHAECYAKAPGARLLAVVDLLPQKAKQVAERWDVPVAIEDYRELLTRSDIGAISVCLPNHLHCPVTLDCLRAGKHVLCEKPIALNLEEARRMQQEARERHRLLAIGVVNRFNEYVRLVRKTIQGGQLGRVYHVSFLFRNYRSIPGLGRWFTDRKLAGGGVMIDWGVHFLDLVLFCLGFPRPLSVSGVAHAVLGREPRKYVYTSMWAGPPEYRGVCDVEEYVAGLLRTEGPSIAFEGAWAQSVDEKAMHIDFHGEKGGIRLQYGKEFTLYSAHDGVLYETKPTTTVGNMYQAEIDSFVQCASRGKESPAAIQTVLMTQHIIDLFYASAKVGKELSFH